MSKALKSRWLESADRPAYEDLHAASRGAAPFNRWEWWEAAFGPSFDEDAGPNKKFGILGAFDEKNRLMAAAAFLRRRRGGFLALDVPLPTPQATLIARDANLCNPHRLEALRRDIAQCFAEAIRALPRFGIASVLFPPCWDDPRHWQWSGFEIQPRFSFVSDIADSAKWEREWTTSVRARVRRARESGWRFEWDAPVEDFLPIWRETLAADGLEMPLDDSALRRVVETARKGAWGAIALAYPPPSAAKETGGEGAAAANTDKAAAGALILWDESGIAPVAAIAGPAAAAAAAATTAAAAGGPVPTAWYVLAGSNAAGRREGIPSFLVAEIGTHLAREKGIRSFDLCGANVEEVAEFKHSFGGRLIPYWWGLCETPARAALKQVSRLLRP